MTEAQRNQQAVALAGMVPQLLRKRLAGLLSDTKRKELEKGLAEAEKAYRTVRRRYRPAVTGEETAA